MIKSSGVIILRSTAIENDSRTLKTANSLVKHGYDVCISGWDREQSGNLSRKIHLQDGAANIFLFKTKAGYAQGIKTLFKLLKFQAWLFLQLYKRRKSYTVIHSCDFDTALPAMLVAKIFNKKLVYDIYDYYTHAHYVPANLKAVIEKTEIFVINQADATIICNEDRYKQITMARPKKVAVIHNTPEIPSDINKQPIVVKSQSDHLKLVYVGLLQDHRLLQEIGRVIKGAEKLELHIGGFGDLSDYFRQLSEEYENVYFYGKVDYADVLKLESECHILFAVYDPAIENHRYSAPNKLYEAMALGKPIIVCKGTGMDELIKKNKVGLAIEYTSDAFLEAIDILGNNPELRKEMGENGREIYNNKYSWPIMENRLIDLYNKL